MLRFLFLVTCVLALACGDDDGATDSGTDVGTGDVGTRDSGDDVGTSDGGDDARTSDSGEDAPTSDSGDDAGEPTACGARLGDTCSPNEYCDFPDDICGAADGTGVCRARPEGCPDVYMPVCGCDGTVHGNGCEANSAGSDVNRIGSCTPPEGTFACGFRFCSTTQYCRVIIDDTGMPPAFECAEFPVCSVNDCSCVAGEACGEMCDTNDDGNVTVTCPGG